MSAPAVGARFLRLLVSKWQLLIAAAMALPPGHAVETFESPAASFQQEPF